MDPFGDTFRALLAARAVITATSLGVFDALAAEPRTAGDLAAALGLDALGADVLTLALQALGYLAADDAGVLRVEPGAARLLTTSSPASIATFVGPLNQCHWDLLGHLDEIVRSGPAVDWHEAGAGDDERTGVYVQALFELSRGEHAANAALVPHPRPRRLVDIGGAHGAFAMALCDRHPELRATVLDLPASARAGAAIVAREGYAGRIEVRVGDGLTDELGTGLDVVSAFNVVQHLAPDDVRRLLARVRDALAPEGCLVIGETLRPEASHPSRVPAAQGALTGLLFYAMTGTRTYAGDELAGWLAGAGFTASFHQNPVSPWRVVVVASPATGS